MPLTSQLLTLSFPPLQNQLTSDSSNIFTLDKEVTRAGINLDLWQISKINQEFAICGTLPQDLIIPKVVTADLLVTLSETTEGARVATLMWQDPQHKCVLLRGGRIKQAYSTSSSQYVAHRNLSQAISKVWSCWLSRISFLDNDITPPILTVRISGTIR